jgi:tetratricopeptide (TPR) repeat protein
LVVGGTGDTQAAIILLTQAISSDPSNVRVALDMAQIFLDIGEIEQAQSLFDRLPEVAQKLDIGVSIASQLNFKRLAQNTVGIAQLRAHILKSPNDYQAYFDLAVCLFSEHDTLPSLNTTSVGTLVMENCCLSSSCSSMSILAKINLPKNSLAKSEIAYSVLIHGSDQIPINSINTGKCDEL